jgi:hypothetical protein
MGAHFFDEGFEIGPWAFDMNFDALFAIQHPSKEAITVREAINKWAKPDALYYAAHANGIGGQHAL